VRVILKACLNGPRTLGEHPSLPITPDQIAASARAVQAAGADAVHVHIKDHDGKDTFDATLSDETLRAVRRAAPGLPVGVTTGAWVAADSVERAAAVDAWGELPDFASVNWHEDGADQVAAALLKRGIAVEAGLWHAEAVRAWLDSPVRDRCLRVLLELPDGLDDDQSRREADKLAQMVGEVEIVLHGEGSSCWPTLVHAGRLGLSTRIGLEDTLTMPDGSAATDNLALLLAAQTLLGTRD
jgi:uncharacterized protein (DUF849 family)